MYADSSFLVSIYKLDANTDAATELAGSLPEPLVYTALHRLEVSNAFELSVFRGHNTRAQAQTSLRNLKADIRARVLLPMRINWRVVFRRAAQIAFSETAVLGTRSFDILHVACAEKMGAQEFITFDRRQRLLAAKLGMQVLP
ncbi:MAG TPA: type II toxin-antitoxin system VapC family toxin [Chthoniobacteraceae bacterium]|jgi:predicted nucleic acid-binding protein|nr:type II toxin-antitoxin system VapC family toxin [Chthoniobacteraceae bacterium]